MLRDGQAFPDTFIAKMVPFGKATCRVLVHLYGREFGGPNIYLLMAPAGGQLDISLEFGRSLM